MQTFKGPRIANLLAGTCLNVFAPKAIAKMKVNIKISQELYTRILTAIEIDEELRRMLIKIPFSLS
ncbi:hypothetical protein HZS_7907 [Henneguya salminicola]|nr:hypothetical protein HZS_7907 [Henneguya salminicola]